MAVETLLQILELFPGPALIVRPGGEVVGFNDRMERWIGLTRDELHGRSLAQLVSDPPERVAGFLGDCAQGGRKVAGTFAPSLGDGARGECRVEGISVPCPPGVDEPPLVVVHVIPGAPGADAAATGREGTLEALEEELRRRDEFLGRLAHDLRNPVAAISGALHLARRAMSREDVAWAEDAMERQLKYLVRQLDDLLDLSRIMRGKIELMRRRLDAAAVARAAVTAVRPLVDERNHQLTLSTSPGPLWLDADPARLEQILVGLLGHAANSTDRGGRIKISVAREQDAVVFRVVDSGKGVAPAMIPRAFDPSTPGDASESGQAIGLALVRKLAELHGGSASVRSEGPGEGSEFTVRLPAAIDSPEPSAGPAVGTGSAAAAGARILIVDDNVDTAGGMARLLQLAGHDVRVAHDGHQALEIARGFCPRFVLLDIVLPGMDGYEVARQLRDDPRLRDAIIVAVSGYGEEDDRPRSPDAGFDHYLVKPVDYNALRAVINQPTQEGA
jgi:CheY-like chemotaxis protein/nitrogen-specific signal transduction histidine kinase